MADGRLFKKLKNQRGVSVVVALVIFLVAALVSMVIVNSAMANLGRLTSQKQEEQAYLAVSSVSEYLKSAIEGDSMIYVVSEVELSDESLTPENRKKTVRVIPNALNKPYRENETGDPNPFSSLLEALVNARLVQYNDSVSAIPADLKVFLPDSKTYTTLTAASKNTYTLSLTTPDEKMKQALKDVDVSISLGASPMAAQGKLTFDLLVEVRAAGTTSSPYANYATVLYFDGTDTTGGTDLSGTENVLPAEYKKLNLEKKTDAAGNTITREVRKISWNYERMDTVRTSG